MIIPLISTKEISLVRILTLTGEEVEETEIDGFVDDEQTYYSGNVSSKKIVQVLYVYSLCSYHWFSPVADCIRHMLTNIEHSLHVHANYGGMFF